MEQVQGNERNGRNIESNEPAPDPSRRKFLSSATSAGALGALAVIAGRAAAAETAPAVVAAEPALPSGYHETEHIRQYYRTAAYW
jgi:hypothetical protein